MWPGTEQTDGRGWQTPAGRRPRPGSRGGALVVLALLVAALVAGLLRGSGDEPTVPLETEPAAGPTRATFGHVTRLPEAPIAPRTGAEHAWTGEELIVWGGASDTRTGGAAADEHAVEFHGDGAAFRPSSATWRILPPSPLTPRAGAAVAWADGRLALWGGTGADFRPLDDGALYRPDEDVWEILPPSPLRARAGATAAWTQAGELLVFGGAVPPRPPDPSATPGEPGGPGDPAVQPEFLLDGALFDPATASWRRLPPPPADLQQSPWVMTAWVHDRLLAWDGQAAAAYVPAAERWEVVEPPPSAQATQARAAGSSYLVAIGDGQALFAGLATQERDAVGLRYDVVEGWGRPVRGGPDSWRLRPHADGDGLVFLLPDSPPDPPDGVTRRREPPPAFWDAGLDRWLALPEDIAAGRSGYAAAWTGAELLMWGGFDGEQHHADGRRWRLDAPAR